uniref:Uncharacterized protein n=1 Tax=Bombyx mori TaxID=7091 RepID=A0A8R2C6Y5_BOMMO|nr:uncharacterized protein LOC101744800 [Bombyx mori]
MRLELPQCRRCFFCIPLRYGIIVFGYLNMTFSLLILGVESHWLVRTNKISDLLTDIPMMFRGTGMYTHVWFTIVIYTLEVVFNIILVIGAHAKRPYLMRIYYYYSITTTLAAFVVLLVVRQDYEYTRFDPIDVCLAFIGLVMQLYLTLLIHNELSKNRYQEGRMSYVNHVSEVTFHPVAWVDTNP